ncbi:CDP-alcohol phosphatidyltransferase-domain-containing protein [Pseudomassariella vexata]|uniref:CDP-alcohol phosphatidyltransferase-domain-containing protein n=1 Tax=Pseudomassariella vexata TaxID=1141098 RepID=A0A1Y2EDU7_9PEZI|nr:CDP-alcohol phosphatidyltransferase-domain-containing protein [Pseudomassariella vexata]ORY69484.1 CDP-alcohol phosphatidyltransferase-domain-containing protein [Pseudomassariella vexata]
MTSWALCSGARAFRSTNNGGFRSLSLGPGPGLGASSWALMPVWGRPLHLTLRNHRQLHNEAMPAGEGGLTAHDGISATSSTTGLRHPSPELLGTLTTGKVQGRRASSLTDGAPSSRRCFSFGVRRRDREGKSKDTPQTLATRGIRKVLPTSIAAVTPRENIYTVPNLLTFSRLIAAPFIGYAILHDAHAWALGLFVYAGVSDLLDGWIARRWKLQTVVGSIVDPMADKILMTILTVCLATNGALPVWLAAIILGRDVGLAISAIYYRWISLPPPKTFNRYWDFSLPSAEVRPTTISKYNTFLQLALMGATTVAPLVAIDVGTALTGLQYVVATTTVWSGLSYVFSKDAVKILSQNKDKSKDADESKKEP